MDIRLEYGRNGLDLALPDGACPTVIRKPEMALPEDPQAAIEAALQAPMGVPVLAEMTRGARSACILICDITRPVPNGLFLRPLIERLMAGGIEADAITVLVATGAAPAQSGRGTRGTDR